MKQKLSATANLTKQDLIDALKDFQSVTKQDIADVLKDFRSVTKQDITNALNDFRIEVKTDMDELELKIEDRARQRHSEVLTKFDKWAGELETAREDRIITTKKLLDHEKRIKKLETIKN